MRREEKMMSDVTVPKVGELMQAGEATPAERGARWARMTVLRGESFAARARALVKRALPALRAELSGAPVPVEDVDGSRAALAELKGALAEWHKLGLAGSPVQATAKNAVKAFRAALAADPETAIVALATSKKAGPVLALAAPPGAGDNGAGDNGNASATAAAIAIAVANAIKARDAAIAERDVARQKRDAAVKDRNAARKLAADALREARALRRERDAMRAQLESLRAELDALRAAAPAAAPRRHAKRAAG